MNLSDDSRQWDYTDAAQRILIAERCRAMLDALASNMPDWTNVYGHASVAMALTFANLTNARGSVDVALRHMREQPASTATAAHACLACGRHPDTHVHGGEDSCGACGLGDEK